jgi:2-hydroxy-3-oxopropionate reductase
MKIAFIGLGIMGRPMAGHLKAAGHDITVVERKSLTAEDRAAFSVAADIAAATAAAEIVILMVPDTPDVEAVLFGAKGVAEGLKPGTLVIDMSSISPTSTKAFAEKIAAKGGDYLDAPVSGGEVGAKQATLTIMVGGSDAAFDRAKPLFDVMGKNVTLVGPIGAGQTCKVANQIIVALTIEAVAEALTFASKAGADPAKVRQALMGGLATSRILELHGERMIKRDLQPGLPHPAAPEGSQSGPRGRAGPRCGPAQHRVHPAAVRGRRGGGRRGTRSFRAGEGARDAGGAQGRRGRLTGAPGRGSLACPPPAASVA